MASRRLLFLTLRSRTNEPATTPLRIYVTECVGHTFDGWGLAGELKVQPTLPVFHQSKAMDGPACMSMAGRDRARIEEPFVLQSRISDTRKYLNFDALTSTFQLQSSFKVASS